MLKILHGADLHLDSPFASLPPEKAAARRADQRRLLEQLTLQCRQADLVLLAGDVLDARRARPETVRLLQETFARWQKPVLISPGNHDPFTVDSPWVAVPWPENVHIFTGAMRAVALPELGCRVWGAAFRGRESEGLLCPVPESDDGFLEIGVFHGDPVTPGPYGYLSAEVIRNCGLDYLALGHIHRLTMPRQLGRTWYGWPGVAMGRGFDETGEKGVLLVELERGSCHGEFIPLPLPRYESLTVELPEGQLPPMDPETICRVTVTGEADPAEVETLRRQLEEQIFHLELVDQTELPGSLWHCAGDGTLRGRTMEWLKLRYDGAETKQQRQTLLLAARYARAALEGREEP